MHFHKHTLRIVRQFMQEYFELIIWLIVLVILYFMQPATADKSLCLFSFLGFQHCPGCGLGHSIHAALHLQLAASLKFHPLGIIAIFIILNRIKQLIFKFKNFNHG